MTSALHLLAERAERDQPEAIVRVRPRGRHGRVQHFHVRQRTRLGQLGLFVAELQVGVEPGGSGHFTREPLLVDRPLRNLLQVT